MTFFKRLNEMISNKISQYLSLMLIIAGQELLVRIHPNHWQRSLPKVGGLPQVIKPDGLYISQMRFELYRWHIHAPVRFEKDLNITIQALGWRGGRYLPLQDDISSVAFWYKTEPHAKISRVSFQGRF